MEQNSAVSVIFIVNFFFLN